MSKPKVAVITRTKERPHFLERAIKSVSDQQFDDYVHVIVNDGGDPKIVEDVVAKSNGKNIQVFHRNVASNAPDTIFNESIDRVDTKYFVIHDDDDSWHPAFLKSTVDRLETNTDLAAVVVRTDKIIEEFSDGKIRVKKSLPWMDDVKVINLYRQCIDNQFTPISTLFRRDAYIAVGKFDESLPVIGDWEFGIRLLQQYDADYLDPGYELAHYHHREFKASVEGNTSFSSNDKHRYYTNLVMNRYLRQELSEGKFGPGYIMNSIRYSQRNLSSMVSRLLPRKVHEYVKNRARN